VARYTADSRDRVRDAVDMESLVSARTELRRAGAQRLQGLCPFHDERTPSFGIDPVEKLYYCFGCQAAGDAFTFVQQTENVDFKGALELLADRFGVQLDTEAEDPRASERRRRRERLLALLERSTAYYERCLWDSREGAKAREYLRRRGLGEEVAHLFRVGFAPSAWDRILTASRVGGFTAEELAAVGLSQRSQRDGRPYDRFRGRLMFPLADGRGRVLGFGARALGEDQQPKYLNTAEGEIYHKGRQLFGAHLARAHASRAGSVVVCEGYTDVIVLHQAGLGNAVGLMGTALTTEQVVELGRMASRIALALDADSAGQEAMLRAARAAAGRRLELRVVALPPGQDPADLVASEGADALRERVDQSVAFVQFRVNRILAGGDLGRPEGRDRMLDELRDVLGALPPSAMREELVRAAAGRLGLSESLVGSMLAGGATSSARRGGPSDGAADRPEGHRRREGGGEEAGSRVRSVAPLNRREETERNFLVLCLALPEAGASALDRVRAAEQFTGALTRRAAAHIQAHLDSPGSGLSDEDSELAALLAELTVRAREPASPAALELEELQLDLARLDHEMASARASERGDVAVLAAQRTQLKHAVDRAVDRVMDG